MGSPTNHRLYYLAIVCPSETDSQILRFKNWIFEKYDSKVALKSPAHITLIPPFWMDLEKEPFLLEGLGGLAFSPTQFEIHLNGFGHFGKRVIYVHVEEQPLLPLLKKYLEEYLSKLEGIPVKSDDRPFHPHVTIATRDLKPGAFFESWAHFSRMKYETRFNGEKISLLRLAELRWEILCQLSWGS